MFSWSDTALGGGGTQLQGFNSSVVHPALDLKSNDIQFKFYPKHKETLQIVTLKRLEQSKCFGKSDLFKSLINWQLPELLL